MSVIGYLPPDAELEAITLKRIQFHIAHAVSDSVRESMELTTDYDIFHQYVTRHLSWWLTGDKVHSEEVDVKVAVYPATMWEEIKSEIFKGR